MSNSTSINVDNLMKLEDEDQLAKILEIKKKFSTFFDREAMIDFFIQIVKDSSCISFERPNPKPYISRMRPSLYLLIDLKKAKKEYPDFSIFENKSDRDTVLDERSHIVHQEIIQVFMKLMETILKRVVNENYDNTFKYNSFAEKVFPHNFLEMKNKINNIIDFNNEESDTVEDLMFIFGMTSAVVFPDENVNLDEDNGFTLEFMI